MAVPWKIMTKIRKKVYDITQGIGDIWYNSDTGEPVGTLDERFFTFDRDTQQIVSNGKINGYHFIFDLDGNLIKYHKD